MCDKQEIKPPTKSALIDVFLECLLAGNSPNRNLPNRTQSVVARRFGVSRELVRQRMKHLNIGIDMSMRNFMKHGKKPCEYCGTIFQKATAYDMVCSRECRKWVTYYRYYRLIRCKSCKEYSTKAIARSRGMGLFCNKTCQGKYAAKHYGFQVGKNRWWRTARSPNTKEELKKAFPKEFRILDFAMKYKYTYNGASIRLNNLLIKEVVERTKNKRYRVKD